MRTIPALLAASLLLSVSAPASAAKVHHAQAKHASFRASHAMYPGFVSPRQPIDPNFPPVLTDQTPSPDDPSRQGGG